MKNLFYIAAVLFITLFCQCGGSKEDKEKRIKDSIAALPKKLAYDTLSTATANFIGGMDWVNDTLFKNERKSEYFLNHLKFVSETWPTVESKHIGPVQKWIKEKQIILPQDSGTLFYPFSGPDFLYGNVFYPNCKNYIMFGLERLGSIPDFKKMDPKDVASYFETIQKSLGYSNKVGYFVTEYMGSDFAKKYVNGVTHLMLYFMARTGHKIISYEHISLNDDGTATTDDESSSSENIKGLKVVFTDSTQLKAQTLYYFSVDASDGNLSKKTGLTNFVKKFDKKYAYLKAASYILFDHNFSIIKNTILSQCDKIVQDDTGIRFNDFDRSVFDVNVWGTYTGVIKLIPHGYQPDLRKALDTMKVKEELPFRISYNAWHKEGIILYAKRK